MVKKLTQDVSLSQTLPGLPFPLGATKQEGGFNFAIYSENPILALVIAPYDHPMQQQVIALDPDMHKTGSIWHIFYKTDAKLLYYAYRVQGIESQLVIDPYARLLHTYTQFGNSVWKNKLYEVQPIGLAFQDTTFDWSGEKKPHHDVKDLLIYELHVRGFTEHPSSKCAFPGTYQAIIEKIPYLKTLGITAVEFLPIHEFNESENYRVNPITKEPLCNFWGYSTLSFFSLMQRYSATSDPLKSLHECKQMIKALHNAGIEVILDVVFNHTGEGNEEGSIINLKAFAESCYYLKNGSHFLNYSGCGNTLNCNHPVVADLIIDSLRYWVTELHVDGFRFDLASIFSRGQDGSVLATSPLIERITQDPLLSHCKLIAEPWDAAGLHQVGHFYQNPWQGPETWIEWNDDFRTVVRNFIKGTPNFAGRFATKLCGSQDIYGKGGGRPVNSINYVTCHDGFSLRDLVSYNHKHNRENGEDNHDGMNSNDSWNCGEEGKTHQNEIEKLRVRQMKNFALALLSSIGVPMFPMGDEYGHTKDGNNNTWCQDTTRNWFLWDELEENEELYSFWKKMIALRQNLPNFRREAFFHPEEIAWHGIDPNSPDWSENSQFVAFSHDGIYVAFNALPHAALVTLPDTKVWRCLINTSLNFPNDFVDESKAVPLPSGKLKMGAYSAVLLI